MRCSRCQFEEILETDKFCIRCGARLLEMDDRNDPLLGTQRVLHAAEVHYRLGNVYFRKGDLDQAISSWTQALRIDPGLESAREMLGKARRLKSVR
ncbi:MAG: tetratricopeptide repeat protein [Candidatus Krumholzibacteriia bacterium]